MSPEPFTIRGRPRPSVDASSGRQDLFTGGPELGIGVDRGEREAHGRAMRLRVRRSERTARAGGAGAESALDAGADRLGFWPPPIAAGWAGGSFGTARDPAQELPCDDGLAPDHDNRAGDGAKQPGADSAGAPGVPAELSPAAARSAAAFYVLSGTVRLEFGPDGAHVLDRGRGEFVDVPGRTVHRELNPESVEAMTVMTRAGEGPAMYEVAGPEAP